MEVYKRRTSKYWWIRDGDTRIPGNRKPTPFLRSQYTKTQVQSIIYENGMKTFLKALGAEVKYKTLRQVKVQYDKEINSLHANSSSHCKAIKTYVNGFIDFVGKDKSIAAITSAIGIAFGKPKFQITTNINQIAYTFINPLIS